MALNAFSIKQNRRRYLIVILPIIILVTAISYPSSTHACSVWPIEKRERREFADSIYSGHVIAKIPAINSTTWGQKLISHPDWPQQLSEHIPLIYSDRLIISVDQSWKGENTKYETVYWPANHWCVSGTPPPIGTYALIYANETEFPFPLTGYVLGGRRAEAEEKDSEIIGLNSAYSQLPISTWGLMDVTSAALFVIYLMRMRYSAPSKSKDTIQVKAN